MTRPTQRIERNRSKTSRPDLLWQTAVDFLHQKPTPAGRFRFLSPETWKTQTDRRKTHNPVKNPNFGDKSSSGEKILDSGEKNPDSSDKKPRSRPKNPDSGAISRRSDEILSESSEISSNMVRLPPDLGFSHFFSQFPRCFFCCFLRSLTLTGPSAHPLKSDPPDLFTPAIGDEWVFPKPNSVGLVLGWAQTRPGSTYGQPYLWATTNKFYYNKFEIIYTNWCRGTPHKPKSQIHPNSSLSQI